MLCALCPTRVHHGVLCSTCTLATHDRLRRLPRMWSSLEGWLHPGTSGPAQYGGRVRLAEAPLPLDQEVLDLRSAGGIAGVLEDWRDAVHETRGLPVPARTDALTARVTTAAAHLAEQLHFIALWEHGGDLARDVRRLVDRVRGVTFQGQPDPEEPTFLGFCIAADPAGTVCGSRLYADMTRTVQCTWCLCTYPPSSWLALRHYQPGAPGTLTEQAGALEATSTAA